MLQIIDGYKSYIGAVLYGLGHALIGLGYADFGNAVVTFATTVFAIGIAHKVEKATL